MRAVIHERRVRARLGAQDAGINPNTPRHLAGQAAGAGNEAVVPALPVVPVEALQTSTGAMRFLFGVSEFDGTDVME